MLMKTRDGYGQFCPVAKAAEVVAERWTPLILREMLCGSQRFNDIHRGVPLMSKSLLSKRLKELEQAGILERRPLQDERLHGYFLTEAGEALRPIIVALGYWGLQFVQSNFEHQDLDPSLLMWDMRRWARADRLPEGRVVIEFVFPDAAANQRHWWLVKEPYDDSLDLCLQDPGYDVNLTVTAGLEFMSRVWLGDLDLQTALRTGRINLQGDAALRLSFPDWIGLSLFAHPA